jgi:1-phosphofructokinase family hexose kinase
MILCVTPNSAVDRTLIIPGLNPGQVHRAAQSITAAGGKGLNVARAIQTLGGEPLCLGFLGGHSGRLVAALAEREGLRAAWTWIENETRTCVILVPEEGEPTVINESGPEVSRAEWGRLAETVKHESAAHPLICFSGSLPPGSPLDSFTSLLHDLAMTGRQVWVDTSGPALTAALSVAGVNVKVNGEELGAILNRKVEAAEAALAGAQVLRERGPRQVAITLGKAGAVMVNEIGGWCVRPPDVRTVSAVGSGDSFLAGLLAALAQGYSPDEALRWAAAAGAANALSAGGGQFAASDFKQLLAQTTAASFDEMRLGNRAHLV